MKLGLPILIILTSLINTGCSTTPSFFRYNKEQPVYDQDVKCLSHVCKSSQLSVPPECIRCPDRKPNSHVASR